MKRCWLLLILAWLPLCWYPVWGQTPGVGVDSRQEQPDYAPGNAQSANPRDAKEKPPIEDAFGHQQTPVEREEAKKQAAEAEAEEQYHHRVDRWTLRWTAVTAVATGLLVLVGLGATIAALMTLGAIRGQANAQMDADRAWVLIEGIGNPQSQLFARGYAPGIVYQVKVYGNTPAKIGRERYRCRIVPAIPGTNPAQPQLEEVPTYTGEMNRFKGSASPPGYSYSQSVPLESGPLDEEGYRDLHSGKVLLCSYCSIEYTDIFGRPAITQQCLVYDFAFGGVFQSPDGTILNPPGFRVGGPSGYQKTD